MAGGLRSPPGFSWQPRNFPGGFASESGGLFLAKLNRMEGEKR
jgi:hypothetical protein